jgi:hypothetical protein
LDVFTIASRASACLLATTGGSAKESIKEVRDATSRKEVARSRLLIGRTKLVVASASLVVAEDGVGLAYFLKLFFGSGIVWIDVGMKLARELTVCRLNLISLGIP